MSDAQDEKTKSSQSPSESSNDSDPTGCSPSDFPRQSYQPSRPQFSYRPPYNPGPAYSQYPRPRRARTPRPRYPYPPVYDQAPPNPRYSPRPPYYPHRPPMRGPPYYRGFNRGFPSYAPSAYNDPNRGMQVFRAPNHPHYNQYNQTTKTPDIQAQIRSASAQAKISLESAITKSNNSDLKLALQKRETEKSILAKAKTELTSKKRERGISFNDQFFLEKIQKQNSPKIHKIENITQLWHQKFYFDFNSYITTNSNKYFHPYPPTESNPEPSTKNYPYKSASAIKFGRKSVAELKSQKSAPLALLNVKDRTSLILSSVNSILNRLTPDSMNYLSKELITSLTVTKETKLETAEELKLITMLIVKNALMVHKYSIQLANLCARLFGRLAVKNKEFNSELLEHIFSEFINIINFEEEQKKGEINSSEAKGIFLFIGNLFNSKVMSNNGVVDVIEETTSKKKHPDYALLLISLIGMAKTIFDNKDITKNGKELWDELKIDLVKNSVDKFIEESEKSDTSDRLKFKMLDLWELVNPKKKSNEDRNKKEVGGGEENISEGEEELVKGFKEWYKTKEIKSKVSSKGMSVKWFKLFLHLVEQSEEERKSLKGFINKLSKGNKSGKNIREGIIMCLMIKNDMELDIPNYLEILKGMMEGVKKGGKEGDWKKIEEGMNKMGYEIDESKENVEANLKTIEEKMSK